MTYFNEHDAFAANWLRNLYPAAKIDTRSIHDVQASDVVGFDRVHCFAGVAGWELALELAGWPREWPVWTGSCPCQPFSSAGKRKGTQDERHLWPEFFRLVEQCRPAYLFGEQVASKDGLGWLDGVFADLEGAGYTCRACDTCAAGVGAPHIRQRLYWVGIANGAGRIAGRIAAASARYGSAAESAGGLGWLGNASTSGLSLPERGELPGAVRDHEGRAVEQPGGSPWADSILIPCRDGKARRIGCGIQPLAYGVPRILGSGKPELRRLAARARSNRVGRLRGYGNAIVPQVAATFIRAVMEALDGH